MLLVTYANTAIDRTHLQYKNTQIMKSLQRTTLFTSLLLLLTMLHHAYGAFVYNTPWRLHVVFIATPVLLLVLLLQQYYLHTTRYYKMWLALYALVVLAFPLIGIGLFEGVYNHLCKNIVWLLSGPGAFYNRLFPSPMYERPDNLVFELTGLLQAFMFFPLLVYYGRFMKEHWPEGIRHMRSAPHKHDAALGNKFLF